jgi:RNA polymerase sigma factor (sigma-70 family)
LNEAGIIQRLQQRDEAAFSELVRLWKDNIYNTALGIVQQEQDAADITQDVFLLAWRSIEGFKGKSGIGTWLYRITVNRSRDHLRKLERRRRFAWIRSALGKDGNHETDAPDFIHPGVQLEKKQEAAILFAAIRKLPAQQRIAYSLQKVEGLPVSEIAAILEVSEGAVESLLQRAKNNLQKSLTIYFSNHRHDQ